MLISDRAEEVDFGWSLPLPPLPPPLHNLVPKNFYFCIFCIYLINLNKKYIHNLNLDVFENLKNCLIFQVFWCLSLKQQVLLVSAIVHQLRRYHNDLPER